MYGVIALALAWFIRLTVINGLSGGRMPLGLSTSFQHSLLNATLFAFAGAVLAAPHVEPEVSRDLFFILVAVFVPFTLHGCKKASSLGKTKMDLLNRSDKS
ncbi:hypothetical protein CK501_02015 [Halovibrio salipaludis]|uniref:Uncharacterized protein n=1 Tax=Halovibrio salipaludis TaxID=2032626 RepID=A0A2A2FAH8_9GAMM|nr:hypothetical protein [Halovibrio salipaludis]PAU81948.1 hypothetical protein CK501_02015 [Halovibrio salipaludis]